METVFDSDIITIEYDSAKKFLQSTIKPQGTSIDLEQMRKLVEKNSEMIELKKPLYILNDHSLSDYMYKIEEQSWVAKTIIKSCKKSGVKKFAFVFAEGNIFPEISQQQAEMEIGNVAFGFKFFASIDEAKSWLNV